jgi:hypothetical protein
VFQSPDWPYDLALLYGAQWDNALVDEALIANMEEFNRRYAFPRIVPGRAEDFFQTIERRYGARIPVRHGDTGTYWEDGAASTAGELARFRAAQLAARATDLVALWDERVEPADAARAGRIATRAEERRQMWRDMLLFGEHTWGAAGSVRAPEARQTIEQWAYKRRFLEGAEAAAQTQLGDALLRIGRGTDVGAGRIVFNAANWPRTDVVRVLGGAGTALRITARLARRSIWTAVTHSSCSATSRRWATSHSRRPHVRPRRPSTNPTRSRRARGGSACVSIPAPGPSPPGRDPTGRSASSHLPGSG